MLIGRAKGKKTMKRLRSYELVCCFNPRVQAFRGAVEMQKICVRGKSMLRDALLLFWQCWARMFGFGLMHYHGYFWFWIM